MSLSTFSSNESTPTQTRLVQRKYLALIIVLAGILVIEGLAYSLPVTNKSELTFAPADRIPNIEESIVQAKLDFIAQDNQQIDLLLLGDSSGLMGVDSKSLTQQTKLKTYNLCTIGWIGVEGHVILLQEFIAQHGAPSAVVYHFSPSAMSLTDTQLRRFGYISRLKQSLSLEEPTFSLPSLKHRRAARRLLSPDYADFPRGQWPSHASTSRLLTARQGSLSEVRRDDWNLVPEISGTLSPCQQAALRQLIQIAEDHRFPLYFLANPLPEIARTESNLAAMGRLEDKFHELTVGKVSIHVHQPFIRFYANHDCATLSHLHPDAIHKNTATIANWVSNH